jgi:preprotein translocase subunit YajC
VQLLSRCRFIKPKILFHSHFVLFFIFFMLLPVQKQQRQQQLGSTEQMMLKMVYDHVATGVTRVVWTAAGL